MTVMKHKGYLAHVEFDADENLFVGRLTGIEDVVGFHGASVDALRRAFEEAVDDYLETCRKLRRAPRRPASGRFLLRMPPRLHGEAAACAEALGQSLNEWIQHAMAEALDRGQRNTGRGSAHPRRISAR